MAASEGPAYIAVVEAIAVKFSSFTEIVVQPCASKNCPINPPLAGVGTKRAQLEPLMHQAMA